MDSEPKGAPVNPDQKRKIKETLGPGQNFYDQAPFRRIIGDTAVETSISVSKLRDALTSVAKLGLSGAVKGNSKGQELTPAELSQKLNNPYDRDVINTLNNRGISRTFQPEYFEALRIIADKLKVFPYWHNYVGEQLPGFYENDGSPRKLPQAKLEIAQPDTYAKYLSIKTQGSRVAVLKGIEDIFDQKATKLAQGKSLPAREWAQRAAAETTKPK